jgi:NADH:ubiquinone oxidoreductase subunit 2 (subunit N)
MVENINKFFIVIIILSLFTYFERSDFNLPLFVFILLLWDNVYYNQKTRIWYLLVVSLIVDLIWIIYWAVTWGGYDNKESGLCNFTIIISVIIFIIKIIIIVLTYLKVDECKRAVSEFGQNIKYILNGP